MWTKHFTSDGKIFYYNCTLSKSMWHPPQDAVVHDAVNARPPEPESAAEIERRKNLEAAMAFTIDSTILQTPAVALSDTDTLMHRVDTPIFVASHLESAMGDVHEVPEASSLKQEDIKYVFDVYFMLGGLRKPSLLLETIYRPKSPRPRLINRRKSERSDYALLRPKKEPRPRNIINWSMSIKL